MIASCGQHGYHDLGSKFGSNRDRGDSRQGGSVNQGTALQGLELDQLIEREWLVANGIGSFACSTVTTLNTRRYHGLLVAAMTPPVRRMVLLSRVEETIWCDGQRYDLACNEYPGVIYPQGHHHLRAFNADPFPRWAYQGDVGTVEKHMR